MHLNDLDYMEDIKKALKEFFNRKMDIITNFIEENELDETVITELGNINICDHIAYEHHNSDVNVFGNLQNKILEIISCWLNCDDYEDLVLKLGV